MLGQFTSKRNISLSGTLDEIFDKISLKIIEMDKNYNEQKNTSEVNRLGKITIFKRLKEDNSEIRGK